MPVNSYNYDLEAAKKKKERKKERRERLERRLELEEGKTTNGYIRAREEGGIGI